MAMDYQNFHGFGGNWEAFHNGWSPHGLSYPYAPDPTIISNYAQYHQQRATLINQMAMPSSKHAEPKPRLAKDEVETLEREFQKNAKPNSSLKRELAEQMGVDVARINNWFQNRRAKEKQIKKQQEFEAQQAVEKTAPESQSPESHDELDTVNEYCGLANAHQLAQPSSAAFPDTDQASDGTPSQASSAYSPGEDAPPTHAVGRQFQTDQEDYVHVDYPSPGSVSLRSGDASDMGFSVLDGSIMSARGRMETLQMTACTGEIHKQLSYDDIRGHDFKGLSDEDHATNFEPFHPFPNVMTMSHSNTPIPTFPSQMLPVQVRSEDLKSENNPTHEQLSTMSPPSVASSPPTMADLRFKAPPPPTAIASRRNMRGPAPLGAAALRSSSYGGPKTGIDLPKRADNASPIRRIASANGCGPARIQKPVSASAPRSPMYLERTREALMQTLTGSRSPPLAGPVNATLSPPTPNTPLVVGGQAARESTVSSTASEEDQKYTYGTVQSAFFKMDPSMRTPPITPGLLSGVHEQAYGGTVIDPAWNFVSQDESIVTPGLGVFGRSELDFSVAPSAPNYVSSCGSQPATPSLNANLGPAYYSFFGANGISNTEYNFGDAYPIALARASPEQPRSRHFQFTQNVTPQDYNAEK